MRRFPYIPTLIVLLAIGLVVMSVVFSYHRIQREERERERVNEMNNQIRISNNLYLFSRNDAGRITGVASIISASRENPDMEEITRIVFVRSEEDAKQYADDATIVTAWPSNATTVGLETLNDLIESRAKTQGEMSPRLISVDDIIKDYEFVLEMIVDTGFEFLFGSWADRNIRIELILMGVSSEENEEIIFGILEQLSMSEYEGWQLLRSAGNLDRFIEVTDLMLEQGLSKEDALAQVGD